MRYPFALALLTFALPCRAGDRAGQETAHSNLARIESSLSDEVRERLRLSELNQARALPAQAELLEDVLQRLAVLNAERRPRLAVPELVPVRQAVEKWLAQASMPDGPGLPAVASSILQHAAMEATHDARAPLSSDKPAACAHSDVGHRGWLRLRLIGLIGSLANYHETSNPAAAASIGRQLDEFGECRHAGPLVSAVREYYSHPNVWIDVSEDLLDDCIAGPIDRRDEIDTVVLETPVSGKGRVQGLRALVIEPGTDGAVLRIVVEGTIDSNTVGRRGSVRIESHSLTTFRAEKPIVLDASGLRVLPTVCEAKTQTLGSDVSTSQAGLRGQIIRRVAQRRSKSLREAADQESSLHAQTRVLQAVDREADILVKRVNRLAVLPLMVLGGMSGNRLQVAGEKGVLRVGTIVGALGAPPGRPTGDEHQLVTIRVHQALAAPLYQQAIAHLVAAKLDKLPSLFTLVGPADGRAMGAGRGGPLQGLGDLSGLYSGSKLSSWRPANLAWQLVKRTAAPKLTGRGVTLRDGHWGTILPMRATGDWLSAEWRPAAAGQRMAQTTNAPR